MKHCFFAVDLGATSGRTILGTFTPQGLELQDVNRFPNHLIEVGGHYYWDIYELYRHILEGLKLAAHMDDVQITSIGIDTWGVDFGLLDADGKLLSRLEGALDGAALIKSAKVVTGEEMSFEEIYTKFKSSKNDLVLMQQLLLGAPTYVSTLENMEQAKWIARIEKIFKDYIDLKMGPELINVDDYRIINTFHHADKPGDKLMEFMNKNMEAYLKLGEGPAYFVMEYNNKIMENMARAGKEEYKKYLERIDGDMKLTYSVVPQKTMSARQRFTYLYDAEYLLFYKKDGEGYVTSMDAYFKELGEDARAVDYGMAAQQVYTATGGKVPESVILKTKEWTVKALQYTDISLMDKINFLAMLGDTNKVLKEYVEAKKCYNQAFMESMQMEQEMTKAMIQMRIKQKLAALDLIK